MIVHVYEALNDIWYYDDHIRYDDHIWLMVVYYLRLYPTEIQS